MRTHRDMFPSVEGDSAPADFIEALVSGMASEERGSHRFMVMQTGYFDDSGSDAGSEYYVLAGFVAPVDDWKIVSDKWAALLNQEGLRYFKMREAMGWRDQFEKGWTAPLRDQLIMKLIDIIREIDPPRVECFLRRSDFDTFVSGIIGESAFNDPYFILFYHLVLSVAVNDHLGWNSDCDFIFDHQGKLGTDAVERWNWVKENIDGLQGLEISKNLGAPPIFRDDIKVRPLQAADMFAWLVRDYLVHREQDMQDIALMALKRLEGDQKVVSIPVSRGQLMNLGACRQRAFLRGCDAT